MSKIGDITSRLILGPAELVAEFDDPGDEAAAKANLDVFLHWAFTAPPDAKTAPPAVALIIKQCKIDPSDDRPRKADWGGKPPEVRVEGSLVVVDAPKSKGARDVVRKVFQNSHPKKIYDRPKPGGAGGGAKVWALGVLGMALSGAAVWAVFRFIVLR